MDTESIKKFAYYNVFGVIDVSLFGIKKPPCEFIIAGLGNPGEQYANTRHNIGFMALDYISGRADISVKSLKHMALTGKGVIGGKGVLLMKPQTYMNNSGEAIADAARFYKIPPEKIIVIFDDISLEPGRLRIRRKGSSGGQNGVKSIIEHIGENFPRIKIGIGDRANKEYDLADYVLSKLTPDEKNVLTSGFDKVYSAVELILNGEIDKAMSVYN